MPVMLLESNDPYLNLAIEEVLFDRYDLTEDLCIIWFSKPAFIVGRNQNAFLEVNPKYINIPIIRRISGGGTIYQDIKTINFSIITKDFQDKISNYRFFLSPIIKALEDFDIKAKFKPKSHLIVDDKKISGNAQAFRNNRLLHHGTLLFDTNLEIIEEALIQYNPKSVGKQVASNKQNVTNLINYLPDNVEVDDLLDVIILNLCNSFNISNTVIALSKDYLSLAENLANTKYKSWEWNYGKCPIFHIEIDGCIITIEKGIVSTVSLKKFNNLVGLQFQSKQYYQTLSKHKKTA